MDNATKQKFNEYKRSASQEDINRIREEIGDMNKGPLADVWDEIMKLYRLISDPKAGWGAKATAIAALVYVISPIDAVPDIIPVLGLLDDVAVVTAAIAALGSELSKYKG